MAAAHVREDILETAASIGLQPDFGVRPRLRAPRFKGIRFLPARHYPVYLLFYRELAGEVEVL